MFTLFTLVFLCLPVFTRVCLCLLFCLVVLFYQWSFIFSRVYLRVPVVFTRVYLLLPLFTHVYLYLLVFTCLLLFTYVYSCFTYVYHCLVLLTYVYPCLLVFNSLLLFICLPLLTHVNLYLTLFQTLGLRPRVWNSFNTSKPVYNLYLQLLNRVNLCLAMFIRDCLPKFTHVYWCLPMFTFV